MLFVCFVCCAHDGVLARQSSRQDNLKEEEKLKKQLRLRMAYAGFLQETVTAMAVKKKTRYTEKRAPYFLLGWQRPAHRAAPGACAGVPGSSLNRTA